jgi:hypothetical protein
MKKGSDTMKKMKFSEHILNERMERVVAIAMAVGMGEVVLTVPDKEPHRVASLTSTGVVFITAENGTVVTIYLATYPQVDKLYHVAGKEIPKAIKQVVKNNAKKHKEIFKMKK